MILLFASGDFTFDLLLLLHRGVQLALLLLQFLALAITLHALGR